MTEPDWIACGDPGQMEAFLHPTPRERKWRLLACACLRRIWHLLTDERSRRAVEATEVYADGGMAVERFRQTAGNEAWETFCETDPREDDDEDDRRVDPHLGHAAWLAANAVSRATGTGDAWQTGFDAAGDQILRAVWFATFGDQQQAVDAEKRAHCDLVREVFGNPFRPVHVEQAWRDWNGGVVLNLARTIYAERTLPAGTFDPQRLAILADALEDAGCTDATNLAHFRSAGLHVRGCWLLDQLLGKS